MEMGRAEEAPVGGGIAGGLLWTRCISVTRRYPEDIIITWWSLSKSAPVKLVCCMHVVSPRKRELGLEQPDSSAVPNIQLVLRLVTELMQLPNLGCRHLISNILKLSAPQGRPAWVSDSSSLTHCSSLKEHHVTESHHVCFMSDTGPISTDRRVLR